MLIRSSGQPGYYASDIAYHYDKFVLRGFDRVIDVWAVDHQNQARRMPHLMKALGLDPDRLTIVLYDLVRLYRDGQEVKLSKRSGDIITVDEVVDEVGADAVRFLLLTRSNQAVMDFDLNLAVQQNDENPVYYVQYAHARMASILRKAAERGFPPERWAEGDLDLLRHPAELTLLRKMARVARDDREGRAPTGPASPGVLRAGAGRHLPRVLPRLSRHLVRSGRGRSDLCPAAPGGGDQGRLRPRPGADGRARAGEHVSDPGCGRLAKHSGILSETAEQERPHYRP